MCMFIYVLSPKLFEWFIVSVTMDIKCTFSIYSRFEAGIKLFLDEKLKKG